MQHLAIDTVSPDSLWGEEEQIASLYVPLMTGTEVSHNSGIPAFEDNPALGV